MAPLSIVPTDWPPKRTRIVSVVEKAQAAVNKAQHDLDSLHGH